MRLTVVLVGQSFKRLGLLFPGSLKLLEIQILKGVQSTCLVAHQEEPSLLRLYDVRTFISDLSLEVIYSGSLTSGISLFQHFFAAFDGVQLSNFEVFLEAFEFLKVFFEAFDQVVRQSLLTAVPKATKETRLRSIRYAADSDCHNVCVTESVFLQ